jgi:probable F420-dependent oxidoreductase
VLLDARLRNGPHHAAADARLAEEVGFDGAWNTENQSDPFIPLALAAEHTERIVLGPSVAIAFARTPMTVAYAANDLQHYSRGRFVLGLGSQIRPHIEKRFSMPWSHPAVRMRDFVTALRAIWASWSGGEPLQHRSDFYTHTLMTPAFTPPAHPYGPPRVFVAGVGPHMVRACGAVADGLLAHPFLTERYLREVVVPALEEGRAESDRTLEGFEIGLSAFVALDDADVEAVRRQISFYGSTPAYRPVLDLHGWGELQTELNVLSKQGRWDEMVPLVDDEVLHAMCVVGSPTEIAAELHRRYDGAAQRLRFNRPGEIPAPDRFAALVEAMRA